MTMTDAAAMTEASGLPEDTARIEHASEAIRDMTEDMKDNPIPLAPEWASERFPDRLRRLTREAPLHSLAIAFLLGMLVARRRR
jgi:hypothetical protein